MLALQFRIRYDMSALVFVVLDVETVFLYPWAMLNLDCPLVLCHGNNLIYFLCKICFGCGSNHHYLENIWKLSYSGKDACDLTHTWFLLPVVAFKPNMNCVKCHRVLLRSIVLYLSLFPFHFSGSFDSQAFSCHWPYIHEIKGRLCYSLI